jgi:ADP-ribose pyrophosphatase
LKKFTRLTEHLVYQNKYIELYDDDVLTPAGAPGTYTRLRYRSNPPGVITVPRLPDGRLLLIELYRYPFDELSLEFPRGTANPGEPAAAAAERELGEETGLTPTRSTPLGYARPDTGIVETQAEVFLLELPSLARIALDTETEAIAASRLFSVPQLLAASHNGSLRDGFSLAALTLYLGYLHATGQPLLGE